MKRLLVVLCLMTASIAVTVLIYSGLVGNAFIRFKLLPPPRTGEVGWTTELEQQQQQEHQLQQEKTLPQENQQKEQKERRPGLVELNFMGRLGNNLFEYAVARVFADKLGWALLLKAGFNKDKFKTLLKPHGMSCFPGVRPLTPPSWSPEMTKLQEIPFRGFERELADPTPRKITLRDWFQDYHLFAAEKDRLSQIMTMDPSCCGPTAPGPDDMVIHYRNYRAELSEKQYKNLHFKDLDFAFYDKVLQDAAASSQGRPENVWIVGEFDEDNPLVKRLEEEHNVKIAKMVADQFYAFCFLSRAPRLVMAPSTFSWWAAFLGNATEVHFPFQPSRRSVTGPQVVVYDEPRYVYRDFNGLVVRPLL